MFNQYLLNAVIWLPIFGAIFIMFVRGKDKDTAVKWLSLVFSVATLLICIPLYMDFNLDFQGMQYVYQADWMPVINAKYSLGVDGISLLFIILTCFTNLIVVVSAWNSVRKNISQYMMIFLFTCGISNGVFAATDSLLFYMFWEASIIPMTLGIGIWGGFRKEYAAIKFFLYTFFGSIFLLLAILYTQNRADGFMIESIQILNFTLVEQWWLFLAFWLAFAVKVPMWPVHSWLPDVHTASPAGGSVVLAALMLKMGAYGFVRFALPVVPEIHETLEWLLIGISLIAIVYVAIVAISQTNAKRLIAYSSISHMGLVTLGIFSVFLIMKNTGNIEDASLAIQGSIFLMIAHAFSSGGMFLGIGYLYKRMNTTEIASFGGVAKQMPIFSAFFMLFCMANVGLPGTSGFVGEFLILVAVFKAAPWIALLAGTTVVLAPAYTLWMFKKVFFGKPSTVYVSQLKDISGIELFVFILLAIPTILFGIWPEPILEISQTFSTNFLSTFL